MVVKCPIPSNLSNFDTTGDKIQRSFHIDYAVKTWLDNINEEDEL